MNNFEYLLSSIDTINGVGKKTLSLLNKKRLFTIFDLLWHLPISKIETADDTEIEDLQIGKIYNIKVIPIKYNFPRIKNLPNKVICSDDTGKIECIFFNSYEGYIKKILPLKKFVTISGKITYFRNNYQVTNPSYVSGDKNKIKKVHSSYNLTDGISDNIFNKIMNEALNKLPILDEWLSVNILHKLGR